jgi:hypothetical protein
MDNNKTASFVNDMWDSSIIPELSEYIKHPNKSPHFDPDWEKNGHMEKAVQQFDAWVATQPVKGMTHECCFTVTTTSSPSSAAGPTTSIPGCPR